MKFKLTTLLLSAAMLSGCATLEGLNEREAVTLRGMTSPKCQDFSHCRYALVRRFDGANAKLLTTKGVPDDPMATRMEKIRFNPGRHTVEVVYHCVAHAAPEKAAIFQVDFKAKQQYHTVFVSAAGKECHPMIKAPDGSHIKPLIVYLAE